jgi:hypothetical protein
MRRARLVSVAVVLVLGLAAAIAQAENLVDLRLCPVASLSAADAGATLPSTVADVSVGSSFFLEVWTRDLSSPPRGISGGFLNLLYSTDTLDATGLNHGSTYGVFSSGTIEDSAGLVVDFGGNTMSGSPGKTEWARLGWISLNATAVGTATFSASASSSGDGFARFQEDLAGGMVPWSQINAPSASVSVVPEPCSLVMLAVASAALSVFAFRRRQSSTVV